ncbi:ethylene-responsive transcription factor-like protein At4g13040 [Punica granatum]|uniref:Ethylene-responsive transcription factor-like protein At4g13040 n=2 Tax=Punica granatum TaxID=22663 RepID=A0A6P8BQR8_PUNGR|nr:ethylene-responsive transcription factor-like protein At4g13040 [Punica granatum]XP_031372142.1 ethylene-responsive transcription factor-like protein At4g13040 [Punica granatum]PKI64244.1 hypothetical protein CRG98_015354 [Punica granatum]
MVSLRRRKLLGLCSGKNSFPLPKSSDVNVTDSPNTSFKPVTVHPLPLDDVKDFDTKNVAIIGAGSSNLSGSSSSKEQKNEQPPEQPIKRRKRHRRKHHQNQEQCLMRGVYFKNMKWQAAIKVDKKQIHLGTVGSQVEAARLYDRAAFMCGREPNFELSEEEKQELRKLSWDEFLALTRHAITNKKHKRSGVGARSQKKSEPAAMQNSDWEGDQEGANSMSGSEELDPEDTSVL